jgi:hypothetical protein
MPPRWLCVGIVLFWLSATGWMAWRDLLPRLLPDQPPPYAIELVEEARTNRAYISWVVLKDDEKVARARTHVEHPSRDVFELVAQIKPEQRGRLFPVNGILVRTLDSSYRVDPSGNLLGLSVRVKGRMDPDHLHLKLLRPFLEGAVPELVLRIDGKVTDGEMTPRLQGEIPGSPLAARKLKFDLPTVSVPRGGAVLLPLHPVNRLRGLRPNQTWRMRVLDPLADSLDTFRGKGEGPRILRAQVRAREEPLEHGKHAGTSCLVIDYEGDDMKPCTWVAARTGLVMAQESTLGKTRWVMYRE